nr:hypothetical protein [Nostoc sp. DedQUE01]
MNTVITPEKIELPAGAVLKLLGTWEDYQALSEQLGDRSLPRIKYRRGEILLMTPLPEHGTHIPHFNLKHKNITQKRKAKN